VRGVLGRGGGGGGYEAYDAQDRTLVALKTIISPLTGAAADDLLRLKQEFRSLADLHHPNLVRYGELSSERGPWCFTVEALRGKTFVDYVRPLGDFAGHEIARSEARLATSSPASEPSMANAFAPSPNRFDELRLRSALPQLVSALGALHASGRVHRDVK